MLSIVLVGALLTYGGVSLFVVVFAVYPFAAEMFRQSGIPKRLIPATIGLGAFTFTMDALPGTPQIQNIIPTTFFKTDTWAAPILGTIGALFILTTGMAFLEWRRRQAAAAGKAMGRVTRTSPSLGTETRPSDHRHHAPDRRRRHEQGPHRLDRAILRHNARSGSARNDEASRDAGLVSCGHLGGRRRALDGHSYGPRVRPRPSEEAVCRRHEGCGCGSLLASMNTASEYGFGGVIAALPGFLVIAEALRSIPNPLVNVAISVSVLAGNHGLGVRRHEHRAGRDGRSVHCSRKGRRHTARVLHRVASMASGGMDTLPHNGAVITLLSVTGLTHRQSYGDIFVITCIKTLAVFLIIAVYYATGLV